MIISPPFLPARGANDTDEQWVNAAMPMDAPAQGIPSGVFPVSRNLGWHGGVHLVAPPSVNGAVLPVRAIADGQVIYVRQPTAATTDPADPRNYNPDAPGPSRTDDGCVVIAHETEIGATAADAATPLRFYSIYMHLSTVTCATQTVGGQTQARQTPFPIYRKDEIGAAGSIYGQPNRIHFEIVFDDIALSFLLGRQLNASPGPDAQGRPQSRSLDLAANADGRLDAVFGEVYFRLPQTSTFYATQPAANVVAPTTPGTTPLQADMIVGMRFAAGQGAVADRGDITWTSYQLDGTVIGAAISEKEGEYNLYTSASAIAQTYRQASQAAPPPRPPVPNASAIYELLRFGRIVDTAHETLNPADVPIWKEVRHPGGQGWVNLRATGVHVYSDADLPQWKGWKIVDSDPNADSRCDSQEIRAILDQDGNGTVTPAEANTRISDATVRGRLSNLICRMPTEWDASLIDFRWGWLMQTSPENPTPMSSADFDLFKSHVQALCFWNATAFGIPTTHWHMHPVEFIKHFRKCGWMTQHEFAQCIPRRNLHLQNTNWSAQAVATWNVALARSTTWIGGANRAFRKYSISSSNLRLAHFIAQAIEESGYFRFVKETGGENATYAPYYGRGLIQLTHQANYQIYGDYRDFATISPTADPVFSVIGWDPNDLIARDNSVFNAHNCADSAALYWVCDQLTATGRNTLKTSDEGAAVSNVVNASRSTNGNVAVEKINGLGTRIQAFTYLKYVVMDDLRPGATQAVSFQWRRNSNKEPLFDSSGNPIMVPNSNPPKQKTGYIAGAHTIDVPLQHQKP